MADERIIAHATLRDFARRVLIQAGMSENDASTVADIQIDADLRGVHTHGVAGLLGYVRRIRAGGANARAVPRVIQSAPGVALVDGDNGLGQIVGHFAMSIAIAKARETGIGAVTARNSSHFGAAAHYAMMALEHDLIGSATTSAGCRIAAWGGKQPVVGNNPLAYAIPAGREWPIVLDMAQSVVAAGKLGMALRKGEQIPLGWALDREGKPTTDPRAGQQGLLVPIGGPKGFGLAVVMDTLSGVMSGALFGLALGQPHTQERPSELGHFFLALDPGRFMPIAEFKERVDTMIRDIKTSERAEGVDQLYLPGEMEFEMRRQRREVGVPLLASLVDDLVALADELGLDGASMLPARG
jgi:LDH2 family malate/lactate/ureidoglycolate dehydrogenase